MKRLRMDYIDLYYLHRTNPEMKISEIVAAFGKLIESGKIRGWGLSQVLIEQLDEANKITPISAVQSLYNILECDLEKEIFPYCLKNNIGVIPFSPIASGFLFGKITAETKFEKQEL